MSWERDGCMRRCYVSRMGSCEDEKEANRSNKEVFMWFTFSYTKVSIFGWSWKWSPMSTICVSESVIQASSWDYNTSAAYSTTNTVGRSERSKFWFMAQPVVVRPTTSAARRSYNFASFMAWLRIRTLSSIACIMVRQSRALNAIVRWIR